MNEERYVFFTARFDNCTLESAKRAQRYLVVRGDSVGGCDSVPVVPW